MFFDPVPKNIVIKILQMVHTKEKRRGGKTCLTLEQI